MYRNPKHSEGFKIIFIMFIIIAAVVIVAATALSDPDEAMKNLMLSAAMLLPTVFILYAVYCHFDNQEIQIDESRKIIDMLQKMQNNGTAQNSAPQSAAPAKAVNAAPEATNTPNEWICKSCGSSVDNMYIQCPCCGADR